MPVGKLVLIIGYCLILLLSRDGWADTVSPAVPQNLRVAATPPSPVEPWFEDSFEGTPPDGWRQEWGASWHRFYEHDTSADGGAPPGGGNYAYRQKYPELRETEITGVDYATAVFTAREHGFQNGEFVRVFTKSATGGSLPTGLSANNRYYISNASADSFQLNVYSSPWPFSDNGVLPFYMRRDHQAGISLSFDQAGSSIPVISDGEEIGISYWLKYHPDFDPNYGGSPGFKHWILRSSHVGDDRLYHVIYNGSMAMHFQIVSGLGGVLYANVNGKSEDQKYYMPVGEWVRFEWYIKVGERRHSITGTPVPDVTISQLGLADGVYGSRQYWRYSNEDKVYYLWYSGDAWQITKELGAAPDQVVWRYVTRSSNPAGQYTPAGEGAAATVIVTDLGASGVLKGWVNGVLRWDYQNIPTILSGSYRAFTLWNQWQDCGWVSGENQERYWDLIRFGPGAMVGQQQH